MRFSSVLIAVLIAIAVAPLQRAWSQSPTTLRATGPATAVAGTQADTKPSTQADIKPSTQASTKASTRAILPPASRPVRPARVVVNRPPPPKVPYPLANIPLEAESASISVRGMQAAAAGDQTTPLITATLPNLSDEIAARIDETDNLLKSRPSLQLLGEQEEDWTAIHQKLLNWKHALEDRNKLLTKQAVQLIGENDHGGLADTWVQEQKLIDYWRQYVTAGNESLLDKAEKPVETTLTLIDSTAAQVRQERIKVFSLEQDVNTQAAHAEEMLYNVRTARDRAFEQLLSRSDPVIWKVSTGSRDLVQQGQNSFTRQVQAVFAYLRQRWENVALHAAVFVLLLRGLFFIRRKVNQWTRDDPGLKHATNVFCSPIATALSLTFLVSVWIYPQAPRMFWSGIGAAALIPTVIILRGLIGRSLYAILNALVVFYFLDQIRAIAAVIPLVARMLLIFEMLGAAILVISFVRSITGPTCEGRVWTIIRFVGWVWIAAFALALIGATVGYVNLANLLGDARAGQRVPCGDSLRRHGDRQRADRDRAAKPAFVDAENGSAIPWIDAVENDSFPAHGDVYRVGAGGAGIAVNRGHGDGLREKNSFRPGRLRFAASVAGSCAGIQCGYLVFIQAVALSPVRSRRGCVRSICPFRWHPVRDFQDPELHGAAVRFFHRGFTAGL